MTKDDSKKLYGIAILLMIWHHLFKTPGSLDCEVVTLGSLLSLSSDYIMYGAWFGKICVAIYAFISGYAMSLITSNRAHKFPVVIKQIKKLYIKYWIVFSLALVLFALVEGRKIVISKDFFLNLLAIKFDYNGAWWYVRNYVAMILLFPLLDRVISSFKKRWIWNSFVIVTLLWTIGGYCLQAGIIAKCLNSVTLIYLGIFLEGIIANKLDLINAICGKLDEKRLTIPLLIIIILTRMIMTESAGDCTIDLLIIIPFVCCTKNVLRKLRGIKDVIQRIGDNSTYMWLVHGFFFEISIFRKIITHYNAAIIIYLEVVIGSLIVSYVLSYVEREIVSLFHRNLKEIKE